MPQDAVQQYVSSYGGPYAPGYSPFPEPIGYSVQSGYEGFLVPQIPVNNIDEEKEEIDTDDENYETTNSGGAFSNFFNGLSSIFGLENGVDSVYDGSELVPLYAAPADALGSYLGYGGKNSLFVPFVKSLIPLPKTVFALALKIGSVIFSSLSVILFGGLITYLVCTYTTVCSFQLEELPFMGWTKNVTDATKDMVTETIQGVEVTTDRVKRAAEFVRNAIEKYRKLQLQMKSAILPLKKQSKNTTEEPQHPSTTTTTPIPVISEHELADISEEISH